MYGIRLPMVKHVCCELNYVCLEGVYTGRIKVGITLVIGVNGFSLVGLASE